MPYRTADSTAPALRAVAVTKSDATVLELTRALYVGGTGNLVLTMSDGVDATFNNVPVGIFPVQVTKVKNATTATDIVAMY